MGWLISVPGPTGGMDCDMGTSNLESQDGVRSVTEPRPLGPVARLVSNQDWGSAGSIPSVAGARSALEAIGLAMLKALAPLGADHLPRAER